MTGISCDCNKIDIPPVLSNYNGARSPSSVARSSLVVAGDPNTDPRLSGPDTPGTLWQKLVSDDVRVEFLFKEVDGDKKYAVRLNVGDLNAATESSYGSVFLASNNESKQYYTPIGGGSLPKTFGAVTRYGVIQPNQVHWASNDDTSSTAKSVFNKNLDGSVGIGLIAPSDRLHVKGGNLRLEDLSGAGGAAILNRTADLGPLSANWGDFPVGSLWGYGNELYAKLEPTVRYKLVQGIVSVSGELGLTPGDKVYIFVQD